MAVTVDTASAEAKDLLKELDREMEILKANSPNSRTLRAEVLLSDVQPLDWLQRQTTPEKIYWSDREKGFQVAGVGVAARETNEAPIPLDDLFAALRAPLSSRYRNLRWYGGLRFDGGSSGNVLWAPMGAYYFVIPRVEIGCAGNRTYLACNVVRLGDETWRDALAAARADVLRLQFDGETPDRSLPKVLSRADAPDRDGWRAMVNETLEDLQNGRLDKLVLARESTFRFDDTVNPGALLARLHGLTTYSFHFCIQPTNDVAFVGASPERLFKRLNTYLQSEALAGTRPRGATPEEDAAFGNELRNSEKDLREHHFVLERIRKVFDAHCRVVRGDGNLELLVLRSCHHLLSRIEGMLEPGNRDESLLRELHPTPAVGGVPTEKALGRIAALEPFERGWYCGPVGWVGYDATEFAVAIRSGLVSGDCVAAYAGAGIVPGSDPDLEWDEVENKLGTFLRALNADGV